MSAAPVEGRLICPLLRDVGGRFAVALEKFGDPLPSSPCLIPVGGPGDRLAQDSNVW